MTTINDLMNKCMKCEPYNVKTVSECDNNNCGYNRKNLCLYVHFLPTISETFLFLPYFPATYIGVNSKNSVTFRSGANTTYQYLSQNQSSGIAQSLTSANWKQFVIVERTF